MIATIENEPTAFPGDPVLDDPALLELEPARPQRELDLEAFDFQRRGYSIRQIAKLQKVHPNTAFNRVQRGKEIDAREPLRAEGESLHAEVSKLRQLQQIALAAAVAGDLKAITLVLRISDKLWRLGKFAHEMERRAELRKSMQGQRLGMPLSGGMPGPGTRRPPGTLTLSEDDEVLWEVMAEFLPQRQKVIEQLKEEFYAAFKASSAKIDRQAEGETAKPTTAQVSKPGVADTSSKRERGADTSPKRERIADICPTRERGFDLPGNDQGPSGGQLGLPRTESEPKWIPTRRNKALRAQARRERRANRARAQHQQSASVQSSRHTPCAVAARD